MPATPHARRPPSTPPTCSTAAPARTARTYKVATFDASAAGSEDWLDDLTLWAQHHQKRDDPLPLDRCVVDLASPELAGDRLLGVPEMAARVGITASTLRGYISRGENDVPLPQATVGGRAQWPRPVAEDWAEARRRSSEGLREVMSAGARHCLAPGGPGPRPVQRDLLQLSVEAPGHPKALGPSPAQRA
ncbi:helix-turn-helix transcriptional regulator [Streptomyces sp. NPDC052016]|uniref:helix-turn-helix transcriptional regulator n=1 Tax=Streptomyces sp. NPDC052016 TaxID=3365680 RepID=UPI0037D34327